MYLMLIQFINYRFKFTNQIFINLTISRCEMGQTIQNPFQQQLQGFERTEFHQEKNVTIVANRETKQQRMLKKLIFTESKDYEKSLKMHKERQLSANLNMQKLIRYQSIISQNLCSTIYQLYALWEYHSNTIGDEIQKRIRSNNRFNEKQLNKMLVAFATAFSQFETKNIIHERLSVQTLKMDENGHIKVTDPISLDTDSNFARVYSKHEYDRYYLSPQECNALQMQNFCVKSSKNDVWTIGMIMLQIGLLEDQNLCYKQNCRKIDWVRLSESIQRFGKQYGQELKRIVQTMLTQTRKDRPSWHQLLQKVSSQKVPVLPAMPLKQISVGNRMSPQVLSYKANFSQQSQIYSFAKPMIPQPVLVAQNQSKFGLENNYQQAFINTHTTRGFPMCFVQNKQNYEIRRLNPRQVIINNVVCYPPPHNIHKYSIAPSQSFVPPMNVAVSKIQGPDSIKKISTNSSKIGLLFNGVQNVPPQQYSVATHVRTESEQKIAQTQFRAEPISQQSYQNPRLFNPQIKNAESITYEGDFNNTLAIQIRNQQLNKINQEIKAQRNENDLPQLREETIQLRDKQSVNDEEEVLEYVIQNFKVGSKYEGYKLKNMRHGEGKFYYQDGGMYDGQWAYNKMNGKGTLYYQSGVLAYQGNWKNDQFQGKGKLNNQMPQPLQSTFNYQDFDNVGEHWKYYQGDFVDDMKQGRGKLMLTNDQYYVGSFSQDMIDGNGKFFSKNGVIKGIWEANKLIKVE